MHNAARAGDDVVVKTRAQYKAEWGAQVAAGSERALYRDRVRQLREAEAQCDAAWASEVAAKRRWHERARKAADYKSKLRADGQALPPAAQHWLRPLGQRTVQRVGDGWQVRLRLQRPYARALRGIDAFDRVWLLEWRRVCEAEPHGRLTLRLHSLERVERRHDDDVCLVLRACRANQACADDTEVQVVDIKPYLPYADSLTRVLQQSDVEDASRDGER